MTGVVPNLAEFEATIARMEARHRESPLFPAYELLRRRFEHDLGDPRDVALSKAAALMLIKAEQERRQGRAT